MTNRAIPPEAERFLARLQDLPSQAWEEITIRHRRPGFGSLLKGFWQHFRTGSERRVVRQDLGDEVLAEISDRVQSLRASGAIPTDFAVLVATSSALGALCARRRLDPDHFSDAYGGFETWIPASTLENAPDQPDV